MSKSKTESAPAIHAVPQAEPDVTRETLEETPGRVVKFLRGVGTTVEIRAALGSCGYTETDHQEGWDLLHKVSGYGGDKSHAATDAKVRGAIHELDEWDEVGFRIMTATLTRRFPAVAEKLLKGLGPSTGPAAVMGVHTLLERLDALDQSKEAEDKQALELLGQRGISPDKRKQLRTLVSTAQSVGSMADAASLQKAQADSDAQHVQDLNALRGWFDEWSAIAHAVVKRRDWLIRLGLAQRKSATDHADKPAASGTSQPPAGATGT